MSKFTALRMYVPASIHPVLSIKTEDLEKALLELEGEGDNTPEVTGLSSGSGSQAEPLPNLEVTVSLLSKETDQQIKAVLASDFMMFEKGTECLLEQIPAEERDFNQRYARRRYAPLFYARRP